MLVGGFLASYLGYLLVPTLAIYPAEFPNSPVRIAYLRARRMLLYRIADPGQGFSFRDLTHAAVNNPPTDPMEHASVREEKGLRPGGFGLLMTRQMVDELLYNETHNEVVFVKYLD